MRSFVLFVCFSVLRFWVGLPRACSFRTAPVTCRPSRKALYSKDPLVATDVRIRDCLYGELGDAVDIIMSSFYAESRPPWNHMYRLAELNRLQQGFPYADRQQHRVLVAVTKDVETGKNRLMGYVDVDFRQPNQSSYKWNPRPYISDLCVSPDYRRQGIAKKLVQYCEAYCLEVGKSEIYIRVERTNLPALQMYTGLGYKEIDNPLDDSEKIECLRKVLL